MKRIVILTISVFFCLSAGAQSLFAFGPPPPPPSPLDNLPAHITQLTDYGARADWSLDGQKIIFLSEELGDVYEIDIHTGATRNLTAHYDHYGYVRAFYMANGDILLSGPSSDEGDGRHNSKLWILEKPFDEAPHLLLDSFCFEGPAVSRTQMKIAWASSNINWDSPDIIFTLPFGYSEIWSADIEYTGQTPVLVNKRRLLTRCRISPLCVLEPQNFRPHNEDELIFSAYIYNGAEAMGVNMNTGEITNYSNSSYYEEAEGIFPDGQYTCIERVLEENVIFADAIDIWKLSLDGNKTFERLTYFSTYDGFGASNPVVSDDGRYMAFQIKDANEQIGNGDGLLLFDFETYENNK